MPRKSRKSRGVAVFTAYGKTNETCEIFDGEHVCTIGEHACGMLKKAVQQGRSESRTKAPPLGDVEGLNDARTMLETFSTSRLPIGPRPPVGAPIRSPIYQYFDRANLYCAEVGQRRSRSG